MNLETAISKILLEMIGKGLVSPKHKEEVRAYLLISHCVVQDKTAEKEIEKNIPKIKEIKRLEIELEDEPDPDKCIKILGKITNLEYQVYGDET